MNVKPYRYPYFQKNVIEKLLQEMLKSGTIHLSTSAFSFPVLLVRKKMGAGVSVFITRLLTILQLKIVSLYLQLMNFWMNYMVVLLSVNSIYDRVIIN